MLIPPRGHRGFTLVELMIGLALFGLLTVMAAPAFQAFMRNAELRNAGDTIINGIQKARAEAIRRNERVEIVFDFDTTIAGNSGTGTGWTIQTAATKEVIEAQPGRDGTGTVTAVVNDSDNDWISDNLDAQTISFNGMGWRTDNADGSPMIFRLDVHNALAGTCQHDAGGKLRCMRILIANGGGSRMCDPFVAAAKIASDPRACP